MRASLAIASIVWASSSSFSPIHAITLEKCEYRLAEMEMGSESFDLAIFDCDFDEDLYMTSLADETLPPILSTATKQEVAAAIANTTVSEIPWANFVGLTVLDFIGVKIPNSLFSYTHNVKLSCTNDDVDFEFVQKPSHEPPIDFLYSLPPMPNSLNELWQAFGAYKWPEEPVARRMSFALMVNAGGISKSDLESCIDDNKLRVTKDISPLEECADCAFMPLFGTCGSEQCGCSVDECSIWKYTNAIGDEIDPSTSVNVTYRENTCDLNSFKNFTDARLPQLYLLLEIAKTEEESEAAVLSYSTIVNDVEYLGCKNTLDSLYTTKSAGIFLKGVRACEEYDETDPCCNEALRWSDCCLPQDKTVNVSGIYDSSDVVAIDAVCGNNADEVKGLLDSEISQVLKASTHPELGCKAKYESAIPQNTETDIYDELTSSSFSCRSDVQHGKTISGGDTCTADAECWSGSCLSDGNNKRCARLNGEAVAGPLLSCIVSRVDQKLWKYLAQVINVDSSKIKKNGAYTNDEWADAVRKFKAKIGSPNCSGDQADSGICAIIDMTKEQCLAVNYAYDWQRRMDWVVDDTNSNGGFCKKRYSFFDSAYVHGHTEDVQAECETMFSLMQGSCIDSEMPPSGNTNSYKTESECTGDTESWLSFESHEVAGYRLKSTVVYGIDEETGNWKETKVIGDRHFCEVEKTCNWDPDGRVTSGDESLCLDPSSLTTSTYPRGNFEDDAGNKMACLQCWGEHCEDFWHSSSPICVVSPWNGDECESKSGGGPNNDDPVQALDNIHDDESYYKCRRQLATESECLIDSICPVPASKPNDNWIWNCAESGCWDLDKTELECSYNETTKISYGWRSEWQGGEGACRLEFDMQSHTGFETKDRCEDKGATWWEGRAYKPGKFNSAEECTGFCNDGSWPIKKTCSSGSCTMSCEQCVVGDEWRFPDGAACYLKGPVTEEDCNSFPLMTQYDWDWSSQLCYREFFSGSEADCTGFDTSSSSHQYVSCPAQVTSATCSAYCWAKDYDDYTSCQDANLWWDWTLSRCRYPSHMSNKATSPTCESFISGLNVSSSQDERWDVAKDCWAAGCHFESGSVGSVNATCTGTPKGCDKQAEGNTEWVDGGNDNTSIAKLSLLGCRWDEWRKCPTEETCTAAGECEDWFLDHGKCVVPFESNEWGDRKSCHQITNPIDGTAYDYADKMGCVAKKTVDGLPQFVKESECGDVQGTWMTRAKTKADCEDNRDMVCSDPYDEWRIYGGITNETKCEACGYAPATPSNWNAGVWSENGGEMPLYWTKRAYSSKNKWEEESFDDALYFEFFRNGVGRYVAEKFKNKVYCELGPYQAWIPVINSLCGAMGSESQHQANLVSYDVGTATVACGDLQNQPPLESFEGSINYKNAACSTTGETFTETTMGKVVSLGVEENGSGDGRRHTTSETVCAKHTVIRNANGEIIGQTLGSGLSVSGIDGSTVCINPTVDESEVCPHHEEYGIVVVESDGSYSPPIRSGSNVTINSKGELCFDDAAGGKSYAPVKLEGGWAVKGATHAPSQSLPAEPTSSPSVGPSEEVLLSSGPTADSSSAARCTVALLKGLISALLFGFIQV